MATSATATTPLASEIASCSAPNTFKFLVHAEDGSFPFLTNYLLQTYFNPKDDLVQKHLVVGIAVNDTCVVPLYKDKTNKNNRKLKRKRSNDNKNDNGDGTGDGNNDAANGNISGNGEANNDKGISDGAETEKEDAKEKVNANVKNLKPSGYTFDSQPLVTQTRMLPGYHTMTLPTFDLLDDAQAAMVQEKAIRDKRANKNATQNEEGKSTAKPKPKEGTTVRTASVTSTRDKLSLNSFHGLQQISPALYTEVALKLQCDSMIALHDQVHEQDGKNRKAAALERTKLWLTSCLTALAASSSSSALESNRKMPLWASLSCYDSERSLEDSLKHLMKNHDQLAGISIAGWHRLEGRDARNELLNRVTKEFQHQPETKYSILAATSMEQILDAARSGVTLIGSALPAIWARSNCALVLKLDQTESESTTGTSFDVNLDQNGCIDLSNEIYACDPTPIIPGCRSIACRDDKYTRSYLHHLIKAKELLAQILLFGHNLHQMLLLFEKLSNANAGEHEQNKVGDLCNYIESQLNVQPKS